EIETLRMKPNEKVSDYGGKLSSIKAKFKGLGETLEDKVLVRKLLNSVPKKFLPIVETIEQYQDLDEMSFAEAVGRLTAFEERIKSQDKLEANDQDKLLLASSNNQSRGTGQGKNFNKEANESMKWKNSLNARGTSTSQGTKDKSTFKCYECGDFGHFARESSLSDDIRIIPYTITVTGDKFGNDEDVGDEDANLDWLSRLIASVSDVGEGATVKAEFCGGRIWLFVLSLIIFAEIAEHVIPLYSLLWSFWHHLLLWSWSGPFDTMSKLIVTASFGWSGSEVCFKGLLRRLQLCVASLIFVEAGAGEEYCTSHPPRVPYMHASGLSFCLIVPFFWATRRISIRLEIPDEYVDATSFSFGGSELVRGAFSSEDVVLIRSGLNASWSNLLVDHTTIFAMEDACLPNPTLDEVICEKRVEPSVILLSHVLPTNPDRDRPTSVAQEWMLSLCPAPYHMPRPYADGESGVHSKYTKEEWDQIHVLSVDLLNKEIFKDLMVCEAALDRSLTLAELLNMETMSLLDPFNQ
nr:zinc finger, CCHC-type [Tanacetum cinerariifolium]